VILVDTSIWIDHFRVGDAILRDLLSDGKVAIHPWIIGELAVGNYADRGAVLKDLGKLVKTAMATDGEALRFIEAHALFGTGISYIDAGLLASTKLTPGASLWTRDKRLRAAAEALFVDAKLTH